MWQESGITAPCLIAASPPWSEELLFSQWAEISAEACQLSMHWLMRVDCSVLNGMCISHMHTCTHTHVHTQPCFCLLDWAQRGKTRAGEWWRLWNTVFCPGHGHCSHELTVSVVIGTRSSEQHGAVNIPSCLEEGHVRFPLLLQEKLLAVNSCQGGRSDFPSTVWHTTQEITPHLCAGKQSYLIGYFF